ncbi:dipeptidase [Sphingomonas sp. BK580]|uniref:dipeptidase n=1 Tax=Sphingomonas sp. BK580 TaxID=2586972 RepID=UPI00160BAFBC|nr:membrane dipeptidase [Sphingomonas sp. BK580]MBB3693621.1 membrane dipeptidase [Sphingomonas sp. BK580]
MAPLDPAEPLDRSTAAQVRSSGLTTFKQTFGGSGDQDRAATDEELAQAFRAIALNPGVFSLVRGPADLLADARKGRVGIIPSFEAAEMLEGRLENIDHYRSAGVLVMGLSYNRATPFASGVLSQQSTGLTELGREAVHRMNSLGVTIDLSHSDEASSLAATGASIRPVVISHAGCAAVQPHPRNKSDTLLRSVADAGGVVGIYELSFLAPPPRQPTLDDYLTHLEHALAVCGEDHVGIGTDGGLLPFNTSPASMKAWNAVIARRKAAGVSAPGEGPPPFVIGLNRPDRYGVISQALRRRGLPSRVVEKVLGANFARTFAETWR